MPTPIVAPPGAAAETPRRIRDLPGPPPAPLFGNALQIDPLRFHATMERWDEQYGPLYKFTTLYTPFVVTSDHAEIVTLLRERPDLIRRTTTMSRVLEESGTHGLFTAEGEDWRRQRKLVMRAFTPEVVQRFFPAMTAMTERLRLRWSEAVEQGRPVDLLRDLKAFALDVVIGLAMGQDINTLQHEDNPLQRDIDFIFRTMARRLTTVLPYWRLFKLPQDREADAAFARIEAAIHDFIAQARAQLAAHPERRARPANLLEALVVACDEPGSEFNDADVVGNAVTMVFAGEDTTSNSIAWLLDFLARDEAAASRLAAEVDGVLGSRALLDDAGQLDRFPYLDAANREAMRLKPVAPFLSLEPLRDITLGGVQIPAGTILMCLLRNSARRQGGLAQAQAFMPQRWLDDATAESASDPGRTLFPFGGGPRFCPGRYLALAEIRMVVAMLAKNFTLKPQADAPPVEERFTFTTTPSCLPLVLNKRIG